MSWFTIPPGVHFYLCEVLFKISIFFIFIFPINIEHKTIRGDRSQKHKDQDKENSNCAISKTKSKLVKFPFVIKTAHRIFCHVEMSRF